MSYWSPMIFHKFHCLKFIFNLNKLIFQIFGKSRFGGPTRSQGPQNLTKHPIGLKIVPNWPGWTLVNLPIPYDQILRNHDVHIYRSECMYTVFSWWTSRLIWIFVQILFVFLKRSNSYKVYFVQIGPDIHKTRW